MPRDVSVYERLESLLRGNEGDRIRSVDRFIRSHEDSNINIILTSRSSRLSDIGGLSLELIENSGVHVVSSATNQTM